MISANGAAYAGQYSCNHASVNLEPTLYYQKLLLFFLGHNPNETTDEFQKKQ